MIVLRIAIFAFILMELSNVFILYFKPGFKYGNSMQSFKEWDSSKQNQEKHLFAMYMARWVANCKLIFLALLTVIGIFGSEQVMLYSVIVTIASIGIYFITLFPLIRKLDKLGQINPKGYSKTLSIMIASFMIMFSVALVLYFMYF